MVSLHDTLLDEPVQGKTIDCVLLGLGELNALQVPLSPVVVPVLGLNDFLGILRLGLDVLVFETRFLHAISFNFNFTTYFMLYDISGYCRRYFITPPGSRSTEY